MDLVIDPTRYEELRGVVLERATVGTLDVVLPVSELTSALLNASQKSALQLIASYCGAVSVPMVNFYGFELAGRKDNRRFLCACDFQGVTAFGCPSSSKKAAKNQCALRLLDTLLNTQQLQRHLGPDGKRLAQSGGKEAAKTNAIFSVAGEKMEESNGNDIKPNTSSHQLGGELNFAEDVDPIDEFIHFNPTPEAGSIEEQTLFERMRTVACEFFSKNIFSQFSLSDECRQLLNTCGQNPTSIVNMSCGDNRPQYFVFTLPNIQVDKYVSLCMYEGGVYYGQVSRSKPLARTMCSAIIVDRLLKESRLNVQKLMASRKRASAQAASEAPTATGDTAGAIDSNGAIQPGDKRPKLEGDDVGMDTSDDANGVPKAKKASISRRCEFLPEEGLDARTVYHLATSQKGEPHLLNDYFQSKRISPSQYTLVNLPMGQVKAIIKFVSTGAGVVQIDGVPQANKKGAKASAARMLLNHLIVTGEISVPQGTFCLPSELTSAGGLVFEQFRAATYRSIREALGADPLLRYCGSAIAACFLVDAVSNRATLVAWSCGSDRNIAMRDATVSDDKFVEDSCPAALCHRALLRFLSSQAKAYGLTTPPVAPSDSGAEQMAQAGKMKVTKEIAAAANDASTNGTERAVTETDETRMAEETDATAKEAATDDTKEIQANVQELADDPSVARVTDNAKQMEPSAEANEARVAEKTGASANDASTNEAEQGAALDTETGIAAPALSTLENKSIFVRAEEQGGKLRLRANLSLHLYCSELFPREAVKSGDEVDGALNATSQQRMIDRILKWSTVGVQGALLDLLVEPIFLEAIAVDRKLDGDLLTILARPAPQSSQLVQLHHPYVAVLECENQSVYASAKSGETGEGQTLAASWNITDGAVEVINSKSGMCALGGLSKLSKLRASQDFISAARALGSTIVTLPEGMDLMEHVKELKASNTAYQTAMKPLKEALFQPAPAQ